MSNLDVIATITAAAGAEDEVRAALATLAEATRAEPANVSYVLYESAAAPGTFVTIETWTDQAGLDAHMATPHVAAAFGAVGEKLAAPPAIHPLVPVS